MFRSVLGAVAGAVTLLAVAVPPASGAPDYDADGYTVGDCEPLDPAVHPGADDLPDLTLEDLDCDGVDGTAAKAFFVAPAGSDGGLGSKASPYQTINFAISQAAASIPKRDVYIREGTYHERVVLAGGVSLYGGYSSGWTRTLSYATQIVGPAGQIESVLAVGATGVELQLFAIEGPDVTVAAGSSYAIRGTGGASLALTAITATGGSAAAGTTGSDGNQGNSGANGRCGGWVLPNCEATNFSHTGGPGGSGAAGGGLAGGSGADGVLNGDGATGTSGAGTGAGAGGAGGKQFMGQGCTSNPSEATYCGGGNGAPGSPGSDGVRGTGATFGISSAGTTWVNPSASSAGSGGGIGASGGGGGSGKSTTSGCFSGAGGGGGGSGTGGTAGGGGTNGGGSFGVYLAASSAVVDEGSLVGGAAGDGGVGGSGGLGGLGGAGGAGQSATAGCYAGGAGGKGGDGGQGGGGGGGAGGPSVGLFATSTANFAVHSNVTVAGGAAGSGGTSGGGGTATPSSAGAEGLAAATASQSGANAAPQDFDSDGTADPIDSCATVPGTTSGCPIRPAKVPDADGDDVPDTVDACDALAGAAANGCPNRARKLSITYSQTAEAFKGALTSDVGACERGELVKVFKKRSGADLKVGEDRTSSTGKYSVPSPRRDGTYYAKVKVRTISSAGNCLGDVSPLLTLN